MAKVSKRSRVRLAPIRTLDMGEKRSSVRWEVAMWSWVKRERSKEVALDGRLVLEYVHFDIERAAQSMIDHQ